MRLRLIVCLAVAFASAVIAIGCDFVSGSSDEGGKDRQVFQRAAAWLNEQDVLAADIVMRVFVEGEQSSTNGEMVLDRHSGRALMKFSLPDDGGVVRELYYDLSRDEVYSVRVVARGPSPAGQRS